MAWRDLDIGAVSAYAIAVEHGYTGTEEEWANEQAAAGENARIAKESAKTAVAAAKAAQSNLDSIKPNTEQAIRDIQTEGSTQRSSVTSTGDAQNQRVMDTGAEQSRALSAQGDTEQRKVIAAGDEQVSRVTNAGNDAVKSVTLEKTNAINNVQNTKTEAVNSVEAAKTSAVEAVKSAESAAIQNIGTGVDDTLSISGKAADAKKTGDSISSLKGDIYDVKPTENLYTGSTNFVGLNVWDAGAFHANEACKSLIVPIDGTKGILTVKRDNIGKRFRVGSSVEKPEDGVNVSNVQTYDGGKFITITPNVNDRYLLVVVYAENVDTISIEQALAGLCVYYGTTWSDGEAKVDNLKLRVDGMDDTLKSLTDKKNFGHILFIGDSYTADSYDGNEAGWMIQLGKICNFTKKKLGVGSATIRDKYGDRIAYPYTSRPVQASDSGNLNTFACQVEKLKRLISGTDLDSGETKYTDIPDIIFIQGGMNDGIDTDAKEAAYESQFYTEQIAYYKMRDTDTSVTSGKVYVKSEIETIDRTSFAGALRYLYEELHSIYPNAKIYVIAPSALSFGTGNNIRAIKKTEQIKKACAYLSLPVIDWATETGINYLDDYMTGSGTESNPFILRGEKEYSKDSLHPNVKGAKILARAVYNRLRYDFQ